MKKQIFAAIAITLMMAAPIFTITAAASTQNNLTYAATPPKDMDYSNSINDAPKLLIKADNDISTGAILMLRLSPGAKWSFDNVSDISSLFSKSGSSYISTPSLTDDPGFTYEVRPLTATDVQITTNAALHQGKSMYIPLITKIDGIAEASVSILQGDVSGITSETIIFANKGSVNEAKIELSGSADVDADAAVGNIILGISAGLGDGTLEFALPSGFNFDDGNAKRILLAGEGSYSQAKIKEIWVNTSKTILTVKISGVPNSTASGRLDIKNVKINALENAPVGDIVMRFTGYRVKNEPFTFGVYGGAVEPVKEEAKAEKPAGGKLEINAKASSGSKSVIVNNETLEMNVAPFNNADGRMMVPLRFIAGAFGVGEDNIMWDSEAKKATIIFATPNSKKEIVFTVGSDSYMADGEEKKMDTSAVLKDSYTFVPVYYVAEAFGINVNYIPETKTAEFSGVFEW